MTTNGQSEPTDAELIAAAREGDDQAFRQIVRRYQGIAFRTARSITRSDADAADATQNAFIRFHKHMAQFDMGRPLKPYLLRIVANCSKSLITRRRAERPTAIEPDDLLATVADESRGPAANLSRSERHAVIRRFVEALPDTMRDVCTLFYLGDCSCRDVSDILNMSESAVKVALHRARNRLRDSGIGDWRTES